MFRMCLKNVTRSCAKNNTGQIDGNDRQYSKVFLEEGKIKVNSSNKWPLVSFFC